MTIFHHTTIHDFKTNISRYIRDMEDGIYKGLIVKRRNRPIGVFALLERTKSAPEKPSETVRTMLNNRDEQHAKEESCQES